MWRDFCCFYLLHFTLFWLFMYRQAGRHENGSWSSRGWGMIVCGRDRKKKNLFFPSPILFLPPAAARNIWLSRPHTHNKFSSHGEISSLHTHHPQHNKPPF